MPSRSSTTQLRKLCRLLEECRPFLRASVVITSKPCIYKSCRRCKSGRRHAFRYLTIKTRGSTQIRYLPKLLIPKARQWVGNYRRTQKITEAMSQIWLKELLSEKKA